MDDVGGSFFKLGEVRPATPDDFQTFRKMCRDDAGWKVCHSKKAITVWTKPDPSAQSDIPMVKARGRYPGLTVTTLANAMLDSAYRRKWDLSMAEGYDICHLDGCNDVGYYAPKMPKPFTKRDFCMGRSWQLSDRESIILTRSVNHRKCPERKGYIRAITYIAGHFIEELSSKELQLTYISRFDPKGKLPSWIVNFATKQVGPKILRTLYDCGLHYEEWKKSNNPSYMPWRDASQLKSPVIDYADVLEVVDDGKRIDESQTKQVADENTYNVGDDDHEA